MCSDGKTYRGHDGDLDNPILKEMAAFTLGGLEQGPDQDGQVEAMHRDAVLLLLVSLSVAGWLSTAPK